MEVLYVCVCVCAHACVRACVRACVCARICENSFHYQTAGPIKLKFGIQSPSTHVSDIIHCGYGNGCGFITTPTKIIWAAKN